MTMLSQAELHQRSEAGKASAAARRSHPGETAPTLRQGATSPPSRQAIGLFRQGQARPDTRTSRSVWDTRSTEPTVGSFRATATFHFPKAYRSANPEPAPKLRGRALLAQTLAERRTGEPAQDVAIANPGTIAEAMRHPEMREIVQKTVGVVREHQKGTIERGYARKLIPEGSRPGLVARAYKHAALLAIHKAGLLDYRFGGMDATAKAEFKPLEPFMLYASRRVFDKLNVENKGKWEPFRREFGELYQQRKHGQLTGHERMRMRPNQVFVKLDLGNLDDAALEKAMHPHQLGRLALARAKKLRPHLDREIPEPAQGVPKITRAHASLHIKHAAKAVEAHFAVPTIGGMTTPTQNGLYRIVPPADLAKMDLGFILGAEPPPTPQLGGYNTNPAAQLRRAMRPRLRRRKFRLRLNTQKHLRRVLSGGVTRQERWQLGASSRLPADPFGKRAPIVDVAASQAAKPTAAQAQAGNYRMGHVMVGGLDVSIETAKGRIRRGKGWSVRMPAHYGYIKQTEGHDGDHVDVYLGPHADQAEQHHVFIVDQQHADTKRWDEHKCLLGFKSQDDAQRCYDAAFSDNRGPDRRRAIHQVSFADFKHWVGTGDTTRPFGAQLKKGIVADALQFGARYAGSFGRAAATGLKATGRAAGAGLARVGALHPRLGAAVQEGRQIGAHGLLSPMGSAGRIGGAMISPNAAKVGGRVGFAADLTPDIYTAGIAGSALLNHSRNRSPGQIAAQRQLQSGTTVQRGVASIIGGPKLPSAMTPRPRVAPALGKALFGTAARAAGSFVRHNPVATAGLGVGAGLAAGPAAHAASSSWETVKEHPGIAGAALAGGAAALATRGRAFGAVRRTSRAIYTTGLKDAVRHHLRVLGGGTPSPHHVAQAAAVKRAMQAHALRQAKAARKTGLAAIRPATKTIAGAALGGAALGNATGGRSQWADQVPA